MAAPLEPSDEILVQQALAGDATAFEWLMRRHVGAVRCLVARYFRRRDQVDALAQETFVKAYFSLGTFRRESPIVFWLKRIAVRVCLDEARRLASQRRVLEAMPEEDLDTTDEPAVAGDTQSRLEARILVSELLRELNPTDRMILLLMEAEGYDVSETAQLTGLSVPNIKVRAFRIRRRLKKLLMVSGSSTKSPGFARSHVF